MYCVAACCSVLQCVAVCCSMLQYVAVTSVHASRVQFVGEDASDLGGPTREWARLVRDIF